jgi:tetratricopeptide (TPR) repeat protein
LFIADASTVPNSALANGNAGKAFLDLSEVKENKSNETELVKKAIYYLNRSVAIHKEYVNGYLNLGVAYYKLKDTLNAKKQWDYVYSLYPSNPILKKNYLVLAPIYFNKGMILGRTDYNLSVKYLDTAVIMDPQNADYWYNLGGAAYMVRDYEKARNAWTNSLFLNPNNELAKRGMSALPPISSNK